MTKKIYYEKQGRKYVPVAEYDSDLLDSFHKGTHLVMVYPGGSSRRYNIEPNLAAMIAAGRVAEDAVCQAIHKASELRPEREPITLEQKAAWQALARSFGKELSTLHGQSPRDIAQAAVEAMIKEADALLQEPAVRKAYERFEFIATLSRKHHNGHQ